MPDLAILDVGHGNCAVLTDSEGIIIIDIPLGDTLLRFLRERDIRVIDALLISHADSDHVGGLPGLLLQPNILLKKVYLNSEARRDTAIFKDIQYALGEARKRFRTEVHVELTTETSKDLARSELQLEVLAPTPEIALRGAGGNDLKGRKLTPNSMSAVIRVTVDGFSVALFTGDLDAIGLDNLLDEYPEPLAHLLVFPHHGGFPGKTRAFEFASKLCEAIKPSLVILSIGRGIHGTPRPEIINGIRRAVPNARIACTQLSKRCAAKLPTKEATHLSSLPSKGKLTRACCAGTIEIVLGKTLTQIPSRSSHQAFIRAEAPTALCLK